MYVHAVHTGDGWRDAASDAADRLEMPFDAYVGSPHVLAGDVDQIVSTVSARREELGIGYFSVPASSLDELAAVVTRLDDRSVLSRIRRRDLGEHVVEHRRVLELRAEHDHLGVVGHADAVARGPIEHVARSTRVRRAVLVGDHHTALDDVAPTGGAWHASPGRPSRSGAMSVPAARERNSPELSPLFGRERQFQGRPHCRLVSNTSLIDRWYRNEEVDGIARHGVWRSSGPSETWSTGGDC